MISKEAVTKICPFMSDNTMGKDTQGKYNGVSYCVCEDCMAWENISTKKTPMNIAVKRNGTYYGEEIFVNGIIDEDEKDGYCKRLEK